MIDRDSLITSSRTSIDDCWNRIGVRGDKSCPSLVEYVHCRNCHVYEAAAAELMNRPLPRSYQHEWTVQAGSQDIEATAGTESVIVFRIGDEWLALPTAVLLEVTDLREIHPIPHRRDGALLGLANVRGGLVVCISMVALLGTGATSLPANLAAAARPRLLLVEQDDLQVGFPVEEVQGIERYHPSNLRPLPATLAKSNPFCLGVAAFGERGVGCLDPSLLFKSVHRSLS